SSLGRIVMGWETDPSPSPMAHPGREAMNIVRFLLGQNLTREDLKRQISEAGSIGEPVRRAALAFADVAEEELALDGLNNMSWSVVCRSDPRPDDYELALRQAQKLCRLAPDR